MNSSAKVLEDLQTAVSMEMAAVHQYMLHAQILDDWGLDALGAKMRGEMAEELGHADMFLQRIMYLKGEPEVKTARTPHRAKDLAAMFEADLRDETAAITFYSDAARTAADAGDIGTRRLFETIALEEEGHKAWLDLQLSLVSRMGEPAYFAMEAGHRDSQKPRMTAAPQ